MGQRLVVEVKGFGETICTVYYHWDAYTMSTLYDAKKFIDLNLQDCKTKEEVILKVIRFCESDGGGVCNTSMDDAKKMFPNERFRGNADGNYGLVDISEEGMDWSLSWAEGNLLIDLCEEMVYMDVYFTWASAEEYKEDYCIDDEEGVDFPEFLNSELDIKGFPFADIDAVIDAVDSYAGPFWYNGEIYNRIE